MAMSSSLECAAQQRTEALLRNSSSASSNSWWPGGQNRAGAPPKEFLRRCVPRSQELRRTGEHPEEADLRLYNKRGGGEYEEQCKEYFC